MIMNGFRRGVLAGSLNFLHNRFLIVLVMIWSGSGDIILLISQEVTKGFFLVMRWIRLSVRNDVFGGLPDRDFTSVFPVSLYRFKI